MGGSDLNFIVVIPARYGSTRLPAKVLLDIAGKPMIQRVYEQAKKSKASDVIVATDDSRIGSVVEGFGGVACLTAKTHKSGTDRVQEVAKKFGLLEDQIVVNVQGDEPLIPPEAINQVARDVIAKGAQIATLAEVITESTEFHNPNVVKVVLDEEGYALYFSRAPIPWMRIDDLEEQVMLPKNDQIHALKHIGIYAYRVSLLNEYITWDESELEQIEKLEQLRALSHGINIYIGISKRPIPPGVDTEQDLRRVVEVIEKKILVSES